MLLFRVQNNDDAPLDSKESGTHYSHSSRSFHLTFLEFTYNTHLEGLRAQATSQCPNFEFHRLISILDYASPDFQLRYFARPSYGWNRDEWELAFSQTYLQPRYQGLTDDFRSGSTKKFGSTGLVEAWFSLGEGCKAVLTVKMQWNERARCYEAAYSVVRFA
jgi:hypothetical protein